MKMKLHETKNDLREKTRRAMIDLLNQELSYTTYAPSPCGVLRVVAVKDSSSTIVLMKS